jgi:HEAT repeat protein
LLWFFGIVEGYQSGEVLMRRVDEVPWHRLHHAYGTCEEFPDVLRRLASAEPRDRSRARIWLEELLYHQGTHYPANEFAVPFLLEAAANPALPERERYFAFLNRFLAQGRLPLSPGQRAERNRRLQKQLQYGFGDGADHWREYRRRSVAAAWRCRDLLASVLRDDPVPAARCWAAFLLADLANTGRRDGGGWTEEKPTPWFTPAAALEILRLLRERAAADPDPAVRVSAAFGIGFLRDEPDAAPALAALYSQTEDQAVRVAAAAARHAAEPSVPRDVTACVVDGILKDRLPGLRLCCVGVGEPDHPLAAAYANLGLEVESLGGSGPPGGVAFSRKPFWCVPFPRLLDWLNASLDDRLPLADLVEQSLKGATAPERSRAVRLLGRVKLPQPEIPRLLSRLMKQGDPVVRMAAAVAFRRRNRKAPVGPIVDVFRAPLRSRRTTLRRRAVEGLLSMGSAKSDGPIPTALPWVVEAAERETDREVQKRMCRLFERAAIEDQARSDAYLRAGRIAAGWLADPELRRDALAALGDMHGRPAPAEALEPLIAILNSDDASRHCVPGRLARIPSDRVLPALLEALARETDPEVRRSIGWALQRLPKPARVAAAMLAARREGTLSVDGAVGQPLVLMAGKLPGDKRQEVAAVVLEALRSPSTPPPDRAKLAEAAAGLTVAPEEVADTLVQTALADPDGQVRFAAAKALACAKVPVKVLLSRAKQVAERGDDDALGGLLEMLEYGNTPRMPGLARSLLPALEHPNYWRRQKAVSALARMQAKDPEVERAVLRRLDDEQTTVRREAAKYPFKRLPPGEVCPPLLRALGDENAEIWAWWNLKDRAPLDVLLPAAAGLLRSPGNLTVNEICGWLTKLGPAAAAVVPQLLAVLDDPSPKSRFVKIEALLALDPSQTPAALRALEPLLTHELDAVRSHAAAVRRTILDPDQA